MATLAKLRNARIAAQKVRLVADMVSGMPVEQAINVLTFSDKKAAALVKKVLESAIANAEHNDGADVDREAEAGWGRTAPRSSRRRSSAGEAPTARRGTAPRRCRSR